MPVRSFGPAASRSWRVLRGYLLRRVWLPTQLYRALPLLYLASGLGCIAGSVYLPDQAWLLPYLALLGLGCIHAAWGVAAARRRLRLARLQRARSARPAAGPTATHSLPGPV